MTAEVKNIENASMEFMNDYFQGLEDAKKGNETEIDKLDRNAKKSKGKDIAAMVCQATGLVLGLAAGVVGSTMTGNPELANALMAAGSIGMGSFFAIPLVRGVYNHFKAKDKENKPAEMEEDDLSL